jgi:hypothetical protein
MHSEILKRKYFWIFGYDVHKTKGTNTTHLCTRNYARLDNLHEKYPISRLIPRIFFTIDELMSHYWHHMAHHVRAMPHRNKYLWSKILIMRGFVRYGRSLMGSINT